MRVLHAAETIKGGVATVLDSLVQHQLESREISEIKIIAPEQQSAELEKNLLPNIVTFSRKNRGIVALYAFARCFHYQVHTFRPDIIHLHSTFAGFIGRLILIIFFWRQKPQVIYCPHGFSFLVKTSFIKLTLFTACERLLSRFTQSIICVGEYEYLKSLEKGFSEEKLCLISNGVDLPEKKNTNTHNKLNEYTLLYVGRFDRQKGTDTLLDALRTLDDKTLEFSIKVIMIGSAINKTHSAEKIHLKNINIEYTGWLKKEDIGKYYRKANCLIIPSRWEGFAMVPLEAISYNLPVITSDITAFKELNKVSKLFFNCGNSSSLASLLSGINTYDLDSIKEKLMTKVTESYTREKMNDMTMKLYSYSLQGK
ncbi:glycosyltransferase [Erwinia sp. MYb416]|uniref:glycosyltransferase n=1 Tax=Erwinia sp. MYb416 TaxID=3108532 RepID=UPI0030977B04